MALDEKLAARVRKLLADRSDVTERRMFGGLTFMVRGHMCCGVQGDEVILRLGPDGADEVLASPHVRRFRSGRASAPSPQSGFSPAHGMIMFRTWQPTEES
jgi:TfoX/Sxy family transcriptional regulator of competence genes